MLKSYEMRAFLKIFQILCFAILVAAAQTARAEDEERLQISKERLEGIWSGSDKNTGVGFRVVFTFTNHLEIANVRMSHWSNTWLVNAASPEKAHDKSYRIVDFGTIVALPGNRLRITTDKAYILPSAPCQAILERVKTSDSK
jgi:hypothetical protein